MLLLNNAGESDSVIFEDLKENRAYTCLTRHYTHCHVKTRRVFEDIIFKYMLNIYKNIHTKYTIY